MDRGQAISITVRGVKRAYRSGGAEFWALNGVSLDILPGTLTILRGRSGSGKTTLMNIIGALEEPTEGSVLYGDRDITRLGDAERDTLRRRSVGFVFQSVALIPTMNAYENVEFPLRVAHAARGARVEECLRLVGLSARSRHMPQELSGGEQQRVAIARAIAHKPDIVFADEPTAELDTQTAAQVAKIFRDLVDKERMTVVMATHDISLLDIADHVYFMEDGRIVEGDV
ncbi:MAG: ABC transporter ATP-binding protein [Oscillospiraceae bacterium]|nr:ABC transporter ATP-binding protein [Oscillospiraceae bacterium]